MVKVHTSRRYIYIWLRTSHRYGGLVQLTCTWLFTFENFKSGHPRTLPKGKLNAFEFINNMIPSRVSEAQTSRRFDQF